MVMSEFEAVIGLEVHTQLSTDSKMFCGCPNEFGQPPNSLVCPVCMGLPGVLPVLNKRALDLGLRVAVALGCKIQKEIAFERKNYFYPDLPKNYQISQYAKPLAEDGYLSINSKTVKIKRVHLEEDAGKLIHKQNYSLIDLNRAGVPLLEIVSYPQIYSSQEAYDYLKELKLILQYIKASSCDMEKGFLRCDANISLRKKGVTSLGVKTELKNMNSFRQVKEALEYEIKRQEKILHSNNTLLQETRLWNEDVKKTLPMRTKEEAHDYRYFPEPDLVIYKLNKEDIQREKEAIVALPSERRKRFIEQYSLGKKETEIIISDLALSFFLEDCFKYYDNVGKLSNWIIGPLLEVLHNKNIEASDIKLSPLHFAKLVRMTEEDKITNLVAKNILQEIIDKDQDPELVVQERDLASLSDEDELIQLVRGTLKENPKPAKDYLDGKEQALMFLVGQVMRKTKGKANPNKLKELFKKALKTLDNNPKEV